MTYSTIALTDNGDLDFDTGIVRGAEAIKATLISRLTCVRGDFIADLRSGVDPELVTGRLAYLGQAQVEIARVIRETRGVTAVEIEETSYDAATRTRTLLATVSTDVGQFTLDLDGIP